MFIQQPLVDLNVNNMAQSENNSLNAHNKARSKNEEEKQDQELLVSCIWFNNDKDKNRNQEQLEGGGNYHLTQSADECHEDE